MSRTLRIPHLLTLSGAVLSAALACSAVLPRDAEARERQHSVSRSGPEGRSAQRSAQVSTQPGHREAERTQQGPNGGTREAERGYDAATGTAYRDVTVTGANGQTVTRGGQTVVQPGSVSRSRSVTGPYGETASRSATRSYDAQTGTSSAEVVKTGPNGGSVVREVERTPASAP